MKRLLIGVMTAFMLLTWSGLFAAPLSPEESFKKNYPGRTFDSMSPTIIEGVYEVVTGNDIFYYAPGAEAVISGQIITKDGKSITLERKKAILGEKVKGLKLDQAVKIGKGPKTVIEVTDPDCPYCRKASEFFKERKDVTRYVFFLPLAMHPEAETKVKYIFCATNKEAAYEEAMSGKLDGKKLNPCTDSKAESLMKAHADIVRQLGITGTPFFYISGQPVIGANIPVIERLLGEK
jgi:thiol:disulfide interchange protein DsbC